MVQYTDEELDQKLKEIKRRDSIKVEEPGFFEKFIGVISEPTKLFHRLSYFKPNFFNWLIPLISYIIIFSVCELIMQNNPQILNAKFEERYSRMEARVNNSLEKGRITRDEAAEILDSEYEKAKYYTVGPEFAPTLIFKTVTTSFYFFGFVIILQFFMNLFYSEIYVMKKTMLAFGLPFIIKSIEVLVRTIVVLLSGTYFAVLDFSSILLFKNNYIAYLFSKINPFTIWFFIVVCIGLIQMYRLKTKRKIYYLFIGCWILALTIEFFVSQNLNTLIKMQGGM